MGPQLYRCGNEKQDAHDTDDMAASMGPQLYRCGNTADKPKILFAGVASMGPQLYRCGNQAATIGADWVTGGLQWSRNFIVAEILQSRRSTHTRNSSFNGAATLSLRKRRPQGRDHVCGSAASMGHNFIVAETRPLPIMIRRWPALQWGRNFIVAETCKNHTIPWHPNKLQWGRSFIVAETSSCLP